MTHTAVFSETLWWVIPLGMLVWCLTATRNNVSRHRNLGGWKPGGSVLDTLDRRYVSGETGSIEYEDRVLTMGLKKRS